MTVWVTGERQGFNYTAAERYGEITFITSRDLTMPMHAPGNQLIRSAINEAVMKFDPETDYLLLSGSPVIAGLAIGKIIARHDPKYIRVVKWDNRIEDYDVLDVEV
jgi:hypothetical protein